MKIPMRIFGIIFITTLAILPLAAESVFLKNGAIVEGKIIKESDRTITLRTGVKKRIISRRDVQRIQYSDSYKSKKEIKLRSGKGVTGYIVGEDRIHYFVRENLRGKREIVLLKSDVVTISLAGDSTGRPRNLPGAPFKKYLGLRVGISMMVGSISADLSPSSFTHIEHFNVDLVWNDYWYAVNISFMLPLRRLYSDYSTVEFIANTPHFDWASSSQFFSITVEGYPFRMFRVDLGFSIGYLYHSSKDIQGDNTTVTSDPAYYSIHYNAFLVGLTYRLFDIARVGLYIMLPHEEEIEIGDVMGGLTLTRAFMFGDYYPGLHVNLEIYPWKGISIKAGYSYIRYNMANGHSSGSELLSDTTTFDSHRVTLTVGYGFNL